MAGHTFVLVHGAWAGAWSWQRVADRLQRAGHRVIVPTLSGLGERSHLADRDIGLHDHVLDVVNEFLWKELHDVVLVGHSYSGLVITGVLEQVFDRVRAIVYLDAFIPAEGESFADIAGSKYTGKLLPPPMIPPGEYPDEADREWVMSKVTPQPVRSFTEKSGPVDALARFPRKTFIQATGWDSPFDDLVARLKQDPTWRVTPIASSHDAPILAPAALVALLEEAAA